MSSVHRIPIILGLLSLLLTGCASLRCGLVQPGGDPSLELAYFSAGDGPTVTVLRFYWGSYRWPDTAVVEFEPVGLRRRCRKVRGAEVETLKQLIRSESFASLLAKEEERGNDAGIHQAFLSIEQQGVLIQRRLEIISPDLLQRLKGFEALFLREFPMLSNRYLPFFLEEFNAQESGIHRLDQPVAAPEESLPHSFL